MVVEWLDHRGDTGRYGAVKEVRLYQSRCAASRGCHGAAGQRNKHNNALLGYRLLAHAGESAARDVEYGG